MAELLIRGVAPHMRDQAAYLTLGGGAGGRSLGSIYARFESASRLRRIGGARGKARG
jgi:hypothetical protein